MSAADPALEVTYTFTRRQPPGWTGYTRRIDQEILGEVLAPTGPGVLAYVCGPTPLVESAATGLVRLGVPPTRVRTERFGPTGVPT